MTSRHAALSALALLALGAGARPLAAAAPDRGTSTGPGPSEPRAPGASSPGAAVGEREREGERRAMVREQLESRDVRDPRVLEAMRRVPRHRFVPEPLRAQAYSDRPLPIGHGQTISQPYIVAFMAQALRLGGEERVLEVGSGSGYAAAVLSRLAREVYGIELEEELCERSKVALGELAYDNVHVRCGDGFHGWPERAPFDAIVLSFAAEELPPPLWEQLAMGGKVVYPRGKAGGIQQLVLVTKTREGRREDRLAPVRFVPMRRAE